MFRNKRSRQWVNWNAGAILALALAAALTACGGGGGGASGSCSVIDPTRDPNLPGCSTSNPSTGKPAVVLALNDAGGVSTTAISTERSGTLVATVRNANGIAVPNALVTFSTSDKTGTFTPSTGTAVSDSNGKATITVAAGTTAGAFAATASTTVDGTAASATLNYSVTLLQLSLSTPVVAPTTLAAGGTASLSATVLNGSTPYASAQSVSFSSPCVVAGKARIASPVTTVNGVATTSYTDLGCGGVDPITASTMYAGSTISSSANLTVQSASAGQLAFVSALPQNISLKGTGGAGRQESSTVTFKVLDRNGNPVSGQAVNFSLDTNAGGLTLNPANATSGANGLVTTTVAAGTVNTPVRVTATLPGTTLSSLSDQLVISTGVPEQNSFSLSTVIRNVEGGQYNGCPAPTGTIVTARLADHFHNPAPDGTAVSFTAEGGSIDASCLTGLTQTTLTDGTVITQKGTPGECTVRYCAGNPRPLNGDGRVTVLAYALGEESFSDTNGNNRYDAGEAFTDLGEPFLNIRAITDANANSTSDARANTEPYIDSNGDGAWNATGNGVYNGVLQTVPSIGNINTVHVRQSLVMVMSNSTAAISLLEALPPTGLALARCTSGTQFVNDARTFHFAIRDNNPTVFPANRMAAHAGDPLWLFDRPGNPLPAGSKISFNTSNGLLSGFADGTASVTVPNTAAVDSSAWVYTVQLASDAAQDTASLRCTNTIATGALTITVTTPNGTVTTASFPVTD